jgi:hypothetical protein
MVNICVCISKHGFGHLSQVSTVLNELAGAGCKFAAHIRSPLPKATISAWLKIPFRHIQTEDDIGMRMCDALEVDKTASFQAYASMHFNWDRKVQRLGQNMRDEGVSLVLADVPYLPLAAAQSVGVPTIAMCSLNWADVVECYFPEQVGWVQKIRSIYQNTDVFLVPEPGMDMPWLANQRRIDPVGRLGVSHRAQMDRCIGLAGDVSLVLVGMGGMHHPLDLSRWPSRVNGKPVHYLVPEGLRGQVSNCSVATDLPFGYVDLMAYSDLVITKPGYGMFVEAAAAGVPVLYVRREGWPDVASLTGWLHSVAHASQVEPEQLLQGSIIDNMAELLAAGRYSPVPLNGAAHAADVLASYLA